MVKDPIVTSGCPQCGTLLYNKGERVLTKNVNKGRNSEHDGDDYVYCKRCDFVVDLSKHKFAPEGSKLGWGLTYTEQTT